MSTKYVLTGDASPKKEKPTEWGKALFDENYQSMVGAYAGNQTLFKNSVELVEVLKSNNILKDNIKVCEIGSGPARNLQYIYAANNSINFVSNDLWLEATISQMHPEMKELIDSGQYEFYAEDSLDFTTNRKFDLDLFISSDHLMHVDYEPVAKILDNVNDNWKPKYILLREIKKEHEKPSHPRLYHNYDIFDKNYDMIFEKTSDNAPEYFIRIYRRKND
tara:strand:+ start:1977 stop:2636 length:660 start_codon:yes stop_codon:yes gene_type:complete